MSRACRHVLLLLSISRTRLLAVPVAAGNREARIAKRARVAGGRVHRALFDHNFEVVEKCRPGHCCPADGASGTFPIREISRPSFAETVLLGWRVDLRFGSGASQVSVGRGAGIMPQARQDRFLQDPCVFSN